jgi:predicted membrane-bound mannosyltransferase
MLAGVGAKSFYAALRSKIYRIISGGALTVGLYHLCAQTMLVLYDPVAAEHHLDQANLDSPYVYSHTSQNAMKLVKWLRELAALEPQGFSAQVINMDSGWPLPWYLRDINNVGYQFKVPDTIFAPVIVVDSAQVPAVESKLAGKPYESDFFTLRPNVNVTLLVEKGLWDRLLESKSGNSKKP